jgi:uncharacterized repeat protein (TIGR01451 family)
MALAGATSAAGPRPAKANTHAGWALVKQYGKRNYAGPNCPGVSWNCTTSTRVLQVATRGGINLANTSCVIQSCVVTQLGAPNASNVAKCTQGAGDNQSCTIEQTGASNMATVTQTISQSSGTTQSGTQTASVKQGTEAARSTAFNVVKVTQSVSQSMKTGTTQVQNALQKVFVSQWAAGSGYNQSTVYQSQIQKAFGGRTQSQNANAGSGADCLDGDPGAPNACSDVNQHSASGTNYNALNQSIDQDANTAASGAVQQQQGAWNGGLEGHVHQDTVSGSSQNKAKQDKHQKVNGPAGADQTQYDPVRCCGTASQIGGSGNVEDINQSSSIGASNPLADQHSALIGESLNPDGTCKMNQHAAIDSASANNSETLTPCPFLILTTSCTTGSVDIQAVSRGENCTASEPYFGVDSTLEKTVRNGDGGYGESADALTGDTVEFKIDYTNTGPADADNVVVSDVVPDGLAYVEDSCSSEPNPCTYNSDTKTITWNLGTVPGDETPSLTFNAAVVTETLGPITNTAAAGTFEEGASAASNSATVNVVDEPPPVSAIRAEVRNLGPNGDQLTAPWGSTTNASFGDKLAYRIIYSNSGGPAHGVKLFTAGSPPSGMTLTNVFLVNLGGPDIVAGRYCPQTLTPTDCTLGTAQTPGTVESTTDAAFTTMYFGVQVATCGGISGLTITYTPTGETTEEGPLTGTPASVSLPGCPA